VSALSTFSSVSVCGGFSLCVCVCVFPPPRIYLSSFLISQLLFVNFHLFFGFFCVIHYGVDMF
jgi:hypothetical protein